MGSTEFYTTTQLTALRLARHEPFDTSRRERAYR